MISNPKWKPYEDDEQEPWFMDPLEDDGPLGRFAPLLDELERNKLVRAMLSGLELQEIYDWSDACIESVLLWANEARSRVAKLEKVLEGGQYLMPDRDGDPDKVWVCCLPSTDSTELGTGTQKKPHRG